MHGNGKLMFLDPASAAHPRPFLDPQGPSTPPLAGWDHFSACIHNPYPKNNPIESITCAALRARYARSMLLRLRAFVLRMMRLALVLCLRQLACSARGLLLHSSRPCREVGSSFQRGVFA